MGPYLLFVAGGAIALYSLWQLRRWLPTLEVPARQAEAKPASPVPPPVRPEVRPEGSRSRLRKVEQEVSLLADAGFSVNEIARRLGLTRAEVQLILGLRRSR